MTISGSKVEGYEIEGPEIPMWYENTVYCPHQDSDHLVKYAKWDIGESET